MRLLLRMVDQLGEDIEYREAKGLVKIVTRAAWTKEDWHGEFGLK